MLIGEATLPTLWAPLALAWGEGDAKDFFVSGVLTAGSESVGVEATMGLASLVEGALLGIGVFGLKSFGSSVLAILDKRPSSSAAFDT